MKIDNRVENLISMIKDNYCLSYDENKIRELNEKTIRNICKEYFEEINELKEEIKILKELIK